MPWEIERHHVDLAEMVHETVFVERGVTTRNGEPARHIHQVLLGSDGLSTTRGTGSSNLTLNDDGKLFDPAGKEIDVAAIQQEMLTKLNAMHGAARAYARRQNAAIFNGAKGR